MYGVRKIIVTKYKFPALWIYFHTCCLLAKNLYNASLYRLRQNFTSRNKKNPTSNELEVINEVETTVKTCGLKKPKSVINYKFLEKFMRVTNNLDFFAGLPMQSSQQILKDAIESFKGWLSALKTYKHQPALFTGRPKMPKYCKRDGYKCTFTNQDCVIYHKNGKTFMKFPKTKEILYLGDLPDDFKLKEVQVLPYYGNYMVIIAYTSENIPVSDMPNIAAMDTGVDNIAAIVSNSGSPGIIYKGGAVKACNQWFNKHMSERKAVQMKGHDPGKYHPKQTKQMMSSSMYRDCFLNDIFHKMASDTIKWLIKNRCGTLVVGVNKLQKQKCDIGHVNNQSFVQIPMYSFRRMLRYLCERNGITYIEREESYTSKASFIDDDRIPVYNVDDGGAVFSGKRFKRGLYRSADGTVVNADINAAANILRKEFPKAFKSMDRHFIKDLSVVRFYDLYKKRDPVKRIAAV